MKDGIKSLAFAIHQAAEEIGGLTPDLHRPIVDANGCVWWLVSRNGDTLNVVDLGGIQREFRAADVTLPEYKHAMPPVKLSTGTLVKSFRHPAGYQYAATLLNDAEWREFCELLEQWRRSENGYDDLVNSSSFNGPG